MAYNHEPVFIKAALIKGVQFVNADGTAKKTIVADADIPNEGARIDQLPVTSNDTASVTLMWYISDGTTDFHIIDTVIAAGSGYGAVVRIDAITTLAPNTGYLYLPNGYSLKVAPLAAVTAAKVVDVVAMGGTMAE